MNNKAILGGFFAEHLKAYIDQQINSRFNGDPAGNTDDSTSSTDSLTAGTVFFVDPFEMNAEPLSLSLPTAFTQISPTLAANADKDIIVIAVASGSWEAFYAKLLAASMIRPEFLETATKVQERFALNIPPETGYTPETLLIAAGTSAAPLQHWLARHDLVYASVLLLTFAPGGVPDELRGMLA